MRVNKVVNKNQLLGYVRIDVQGGPELEAILGELQDVATTAESDHPYLTILRDRVVSAIRS